jgi:hypothetical protein
MKSRAVHPSTPVIRVCSFNDIVEHPSWVPFPILASTRTVLLRMLAELTIVNIVQYICNILRDRIKVAGFEFAYVVPCGLYTYPLLGETQGMPALRQIIMPLI